MKNAFYSIEEFISVEFIMFLLILCNFVTCFFDLTAYCNLALFMMYSTFNLTCADDGSVNVHLCVCVCVMYVRTYVCR